MGPFQLQNSFYTSVSSKTDNDIDNIAIMYYLLYVS
jgi:hypothetical protein